MSEIYINYTDIFETSHSHLQQYETDLDTYSNGTIKEITELMNNLNHKYTPVFMDIYKKMIGKKTDQKINFIEEKIHEITMCFKHIKNINKFQRKILL